MRLHRTERLQPPAHLAGSAGQAYPLRAYVCAGRRAQGDAGAEYPYGECCPEAIDRAVHYAAQFGRPIYILENGVPDREDRLRGWLLVHAIRRLHQLLETGYDIRGYFHWTLVDSFEWSEGWRLRFGLYELDPVTQKRRARPSAQLYRQIVRANGLPSSLFREFGSLPESCSLQVQTDK